ncbi:Deoxyhypusine synthase [Artemisia annua]|uniref:Deoxyhypusine synthase n=1 Tax=Artemisia annua TaxID=35608 RepID=A0A2U1KRY1_ARTAN|nr:Deoxyhypusine synthase [Artemisia annua]
MKRKSDVLEAVFKESVSLEDTCTKIKGYDFNNGVNISEIIDFMATTGFQASNLADAIDIVNHMVEVIVTTADGIGEDLIKCLADTYRDEFSLPGAALSSKGLNRIGNLLVPDDNYCKFKDWINPILDQMLEEQKAKNDIPVFCPGLTDGCLGKVLYDHSIRNPGLVMDILQDYAVFINTAQEFDGSDSGASPDEAVSWGKYVVLVVIQVHCDATIAFPLLVAKTFAAKREKPSEPGSDVIDIVRSVVFKESESLEDTCGLKIRGYDFNNGVNYLELLKSLVSTGFQASNLGDAIDTVNQMMEYYVLAKEPNVLCRYFNIPRFYFMLLDWRLSHEQVTQDCSVEEKNSTYRESVKCKIFLGFTSNLISSGVRDIIWYLVQHHMVDAIVTTTGGIEEDLIKCLADTYRGDFSLSGAALRSDGLNRIGNLLVPNGNYCEFNDWIIPIFDQMLDEQKTKNVLWTPSKATARLGKEINNESSYLYWAYKNDIPVFCPGLTDGSLGDMLYIHSFRDLSLVVDVVQDIRAINGEAVHANPRKTGMIILGWGLPKHHICNANMMRNGADYAVYINTAQEFDGSDSGASPDEAVSWGKIRGSAKSVKVHCDATIAFPLLVAQTFAQKRETS